MLLAAPNEFIQDSRALYRSFALQAAACVVLGSLIPTFIYFGGHLDAFHMDQVQTSLSASVIASVVGVFFARRLNVYPGVKQLGAILPTFVASFCLAGAVILGFRFPYSIPVFACNFAFSLATYLALMVAGTRADQKVLYTVPGGRIDRLASAGLHTRQLAEPALPSERGAIIAADLHHRHHADWERLLANAALESVPVFHFKQVMEAATGRVQIEHLAENSFGSLLPNMSFMRVKRLADILLVAMLLPLLIVPLLIVALLVRLDSPGPVLFRQERIGYRGRPFCMTKFRTMRVEAAPRKEADRRLMAMTSDNDPRITKLGTFLRRTRIDELPQMLNILLGHMSWIGPRPEAAELSSYYRAEIPFYDYRHIVRPGITGWAQVNQGHVTTLSDVNDKLQYDFYYIKNFSYWLDLLILARTVRVILTGSGAR
jgi:lipopolysaccharide/colanic/teichoic acid biosynthesis glycosyltransferase